MKFRWTYGVLALVVACGSACSAFGLFGDEDVPNELVGQRIAYERVLDGVLELSARLYKADSQQFVRLTDNGHGDVQPAWSPDGQKIAFVSDRTGDAEIFVMNADGTDVVQLTNNPAADVEPSWSPDGKSIAFYHCVIKNSFYPFN